MMGKKWFEAVLSAGMALVAIAAPEASAQPPTNEQSSQAIYDAREALASKEMKDRLAKMRQDITSNGYTFKVGYTTALDVDLRTIADYKPPTTSQRQEISRRLEEAKQKQGMKRTMSVSASPPSTFNWHTQGKVSSVRNQGTYGNSWAFAAVGAYESNYLIRHNIIINASEESIIDQTPLGSGPGGGLAEDAFITMMAFGMAKESSYRYQGIRNPFPSGSVARPYKASIFGYAGIPATIASTNDIKKAVMEKGPVASAMYANALFQAYSADVYNFYIPSSTPANHVVLIVGWDNAKNAWRIKNSWGTTWGESGYGWIKYGTSLIGFDACWVESIRAN